MHDAHILLTMRWNKTIQFRECTVSIALVRFPAKSLCGVSATLCAFSLTAVSTSQPLCSPGNSTRQSEVAEAFTEAKCVFFVLISALFSPT